MDLVESTLGSLRAALIAAAFLIGWVSSLLDSQSNRHQRFYELTKRGLEMALNRQDDGAFKRALKDGQDLFGRLPRIEREIRILIVVVWLLLLISAFLTWIAVWLSDGFNLLQFWVAQRHHIAAYTHVSITLALAPGAYVVYAWLGGIVKQRKMYVVQFRLLAGAGVASIDSQAFREQLRALEDELETTWLNRLFRRMHSEPK